MNTEPLSLENILYAIKNSMIELIAEDDPLVAEISRYSFDGGGKRLRPLLFCLGSLAVGQKLDKKLLALASSFEFLHMATLLHDDIVDEAETRRGRLAAHLHFGTKEAVLAGDYLLAKAAQIVANCNKPQATSIMAQIVSTLSLGELVQLRSRHKIDLSEKDYFTIIFRKTAALIQGALETAAIMCEAPENYQSALATYGRELGLSFQIMDDILDYETSSLEFGKPVGHDIEEGQITLPFIMARNHLSAPQSRLLSSLMAETETSEKVQREIIDLVKVGGGLELARQKVAESVAKAVLALKPLPESAAKNELIRIAQNSNQRSS